MKIQDVEFPIILIDAETTDFFPIKHIKQIITSTNKTIKLKKMVGTEIIDAQSRLFRVIDVHKITTKPTRSFIELFDRTIEIDIDVEEVTSSYPLTETKRRLLKIISNEMDIGSDLWSQFEDKKDLFTKFDSAIDVKMIIRLLSN